MAIVAPAVLAYISTGVKPDMVFGDDADRFDIASVMQDQNRNMENDARKSNTHHSVVNALKNILYASRKSNPAASVGKARKSNTDFAYHDTMVQNNKNEDDFEENLQKLVKNSQFNRRLQATVRSLHDGNDFARRYNKPDLESEILMHYAVPITMEVVGHLQIPEELKE
ncbi:uncharacterized protein LOC105841613 [Bombyx mori]|uniref:Uncharacterized protein n=1 Tax=Bombyx mori TaxID=7091 RepID=A0A8R2G7R4_BOMMO|nr:uncharacterized protein LOC105841613 [Bombyx mori]